MLEVVFRRHRTFFLGASAAAFAVLVASPYLPVEYDATARVELQPESVTGDTALSQGGPIVPADRTTAIVGRAAVEKAADDLGLTRWLPPDAALDPGTSSPTVRQEVIGGLMRSLRVSREPRPGQADVIAITCTHRDPLLARDLPNRLVKNYALVAEGHRLKRLGEIRDALQKQVNDCDARLADLTKRQIDFETKHGAAMPESPGVIHQRIQEIRAQIDALRVQESAARQKVERLKLLAKTTKPPEEPQEVVKGPNPVYKSLEDQLREVQAEYYAATNIRKMLEDHPTVQMLRKRIEGLEKQIKETPQETVIQKIYAPKATTSTDLAVQLATAQSEVDKAALDIERLGARLAEAQNDLAKFGPARGEYLGLLKQVDEERAELRRRQDRLAEAQAALAVEGAKRETGMETAQLAEKPLRPSFPALWHVLGLALVGGLTAGSGLALAAHAMDRTITTADGAAGAFNVPVCGVISEMVSPGRRLVRGLNRWVLRPTIVLAVLAALGLAVLNVVLWLHYPDQYERWGEHPRTFLYQELAKLAGRLDPSP